MADLKNIFLIISVFASAIVYASGAPAKQELESKPTLGSTAVISNEIENDLSQEISKTPRATTTEAPVTVLDRFYRVYEDGTTEWKIVLSNDVAQYQKITNKLYQGRTIQVYEGYNYSKLPDNTYRINHYIADENGYRRLRQIFDNKPIPLPPYVPYVPRV